MDKNITDFNLVMEEAKKYLSKEESLSLIEKAFNYASEKHAGQRRKNGDPYVYHVINVAYILATLQAGPQTIAAGLLHDVVEDCGVTVDEIKKLFDEDVAFLVEGVTKINKLSNSVSQQEDYEAENHRKIFIAMAKDIRVILIKLADRLHNMRTLSFHNDMDKERRIADETLKIYAPIAHRLGINTVKSELEDLSLKYLEPEKYHNIKTLLDAKESTRKAILGRMSSHLTELLKKYNIPHYSYGRVKSIYSIYKKMYIAGKAFDEIYDLQALRVITDSIPRCYEILGYIHAVYRPIPGRFKDYIAMPKPNLYQSLHTTIVAEDGQIFEIQIRTQEMEEVAETGIAAHWRYKENTEYSSKAEQKEIEEKLHWFRDFINMTDENSSSDAKEYIESLTKDIFEANVYCLTPLGRVIELPNGSTPVDFAYRIHTHVGHSTIGATVNGVLVPLSTVLKTGDVVDIKTSKTQNPLPNEGWLKFVRTNTAKNSIKKALLKYNNELRKDEIIEEGRKQIEEGVRNDKNLIYHEVIHIIEDEKFLKEFQVENVTTLYVAISNHTISVNQILNKLREKTKKADQITPFNRKKNLSNSNGLIVPGIDNVAVSFSQCCSPIPGDEIVGYIAQGRGIKVHRKDCSTIKRGRQRTIDVYWDYDYFKENPQLHYVDIQIKSQDRNNLLTDVINHLSVLKINCQSASMNKDPNTFNVSLNLCIQVYDIEHLNEVCNSLKSHIAGVYDVIRTTKN